MTTTTPPTGGTPPLADEELQAFCDAAPERIDSPLWTHLDWSLWGTGLGDTLREPMASAMVAAIPAEVRAHAEMVMAEFLKFRGVESPAEANAELRAEVKRLRAELATVSDEAGVQCREAAARTVRAEKERDALAAALDQFRSFPTDPGPGNWSTSYRMGYGDAGRDVRAIAAALGETGGTE